MDIYQYAHIGSANANSTVTIQTNDCVLSKITINTTSAQALTVKDGLGNTVATLKASVVENSYFYEVACPKGLTITVPASYTGDATIAFR